MGTRTPPGWLAGPLHFQPPCMDHAHFRPTRSLCSDGGQDQQHPGRQHQHGSHERHVHHGQLHAPGMDRHDLLCECAALARPLCAAPAMTPPPPHTHTLVFPPPPTHHTPTASGVQTPHSARVGRHRRFVRQFHFGAAAGQRHDHRDQHHWDRLQGRLPGQEGQEGLPCGGRGAPHPPHARRRVAHGQDVWDVPPLTRRPRHAPRRATPPIAPPSPSRHAPAAHHTPLFTHPPTHHAWRLPHPSPSSSPPPHTPPKNCYPRAAPPSPPSPRACVTSPPPPHPPF